MLDVAVLTPTPGVELPFFVLAKPSQLLPALAAVAIIAHVFRVVFLVRMRAGCVLHKPPTCWLVRAISGVPFGDEDVGQEEGGWTLNCKVFIEQREHSTEDILLRF